MPPPVAGSIRTTAAAQAYRVALSLNNMAISVLKRGCYQLALKTLDQSLLLMKGIFISESEFSGLTEAIDEMFEAATQQCASPQEEAEERLPLDPDLNVLDEENLQDLWLAANRAPSRSTAHFVQISESASAMSSQEIVPSNDVGTQVGIVYYNHGLANMIKSNREQEGRTGQFLHAARQSVQMADIIFSSLCEEGASAPNNRGGPDLPPLVLSAVVLNCLSLVYDRQELLSRSEEARRIVEYIRNRIDENPRLRRLLLRDTAAAA